MNFLDPASAVFRRNAAGTLDLEVAGAKPASGLLCVPMFPLRDPDRFVSLVRRTPAGLEEVGVVREVGALSAAQRELIREQVRFRYFLPDILDILRVTPAAGALELEVVTDRGRHAILVQNPRESITVTDDGIVLIADLEKCRYRIGDLAALPPRARLLLEKIML